MQSASISRPHRWHSMEDATKPKIIQIPSRSSCSPNFDVWATSEVGVPFSEFANPAHGRKPPNSLALTVSVDSKMSPVDTRLGRDLRKLFREHDSQELVSPGECESKTARSSSSSSLSLKAITVANNSVPSKNDSASETRHDGGSNFCQELKPRPSSPIVSVIDADNPGEESNSDADNHDGASCVERRPTTV